MNTAATNEPRIIAINVPKDSLAPDLAVEVLSESNTPAWLVDSKSRTVAVYQSPDSFTVLTEKDTLGSNVLPGFSLPLADLFAELEGDSGLPA